MNQTWKRKFFTIILGQMASLIGSSAVQFALIWWIASETASVTMMGLAGLVAFLPAAFLGPVAGVLADRYPRKYICITADLFIGVTSVVFAALLWRFDLPIWTALVILLLRGVGGVFHQPALQAMIPQFVPPEELVRAGGWQQLCMSGSFLLGPAIGAALYAAFSLPIILLTDLVGALIASGMLAVVSIPRHGRTDQEKRNTWREMKEGIVVFLEDRPLGLIVLVQTACMLFYMPLSSFYPLMTSDYFSASAWHGSAVEVLYAAGMMLAAFLFGSVVKVKRHLLVCYLGMLGLGLTAAACGLLPPTMKGWVAFAVVCALMGACGNVMGIPFVAYMQSTVSPEKMGRAFSAIGVVSSLAMPVGLVIATPIAEQVGVHMWFLLAGVGTILVTLAGLLLHGKLQRGAEIGRAHV